MVSSPFKLGPAPAVKPNFYHAPIKLDLTFPEPLTIYPGETLRIEHIVTTDEFRNVVNVQVVKVEKADS